MKKLLTLLFALALTMSLSAGAFAQDAGTADQGKDKKEMKADSTTKKQAHKGAKKGKKSMKKDKKDEAAPKA